MDVTYTDRKGTPWVFSMNCTPYQANIFAKLLRAVRNMGNREALTLEYYDNFEDNEDFCEYVENVLLSALKDVQPREPLPQTTGPTLAELLADDSTATAATPRVWNEYADDTADSDEDEDEPQYYWEKF